MLATDTHRNARGHQPGGPARILRRAHGAALLHQPRLQIAFDRTTGDYQLALLTT
jgi:hypothetical protein